MCFHHCTQSVDVRHHLREKRLLLGTGVHPAACTGAVPPCSQSATHKAKGGLAGCTTHNKAPSPSAYSKDLCISRQLIGMPVRIQLSPPSTKSATYRTDLFHTQDLASPKAYSRVAHCPIYSQCQRSCVHHCGIWTPPSSTQVSAPDSSGT